MARFELENQKSGHNSSDLVKAVTCNPAAILGWGQYLGSLKPGAFADLLVVGGTGADPYDHLIDATEQDLRLVVVHGIPRYGIKNIMLRIHSDTQNDLETIVIGEEERSLYLYASGSSLNDLTFEQSRETLTNAMADLPAFLLSTKEENNRLKAMGIRVEQKFRIVLDNELVAPKTRTFDLSAMAAKAEVDWSKIVKSVELDRPEVDSPSYYERLKEQVNIDDGLR
ncbi:Amidohydrolase family protein [uncultured archaeon]|nr:Amidohydrolase family protein [uncultured archaeon]